MYAILIVIALLLLAYYYRQNERITEACLRPQVFIIDSGKPGPCLGILASVHGNEPAGAYTLTKMIKNKELKPKTGKLIIIPEGNPCGIMQNTRENPYSQLDINRQFSEEGGNDETSQIIVNTFKNCDIILDFHEGWSFHLETKASRNPFQQISVGSTITPGEHKIWETLAPKIVEELNITIKEPLKKWSIIWGASCKIASSFNCYAHLNNRPYLLIETSGQEDIQPLEVREKQIRTILRVIIDNVMRE